MAITKIHAIKVRLGDAINYIENPDKTDGQDSHYAHTDPAPYCPPTSSQSVFHFYNGGYLAFCLYMYNLFIV